MIFLGHIYYNYNCNSRQSSQSITLFKEEGRTIMKKQLSQVTVGILVSLCSIFGTNAAFNDYGERIKTKETSMAAKGKSTIKRMESKAKEKMSTTKENDVMLKDQKAVNKKIVSFLKRKLKQIENQHESYSNFIERNDEQLNQAQTNKLQEIQKKYATIKDHLEKTIEKHETLLEKMK